MTEKQALDLLNKYQLSATRIFHCQVAAEFAFDLASSIADRHPALNIDPQKIKMGALLHDIGRSQEGDHEIESVKLLEKEGHEDIAQIVMHGTAYEAFQLQGIERKDLLPKSIENKIVAYSDARCRLSVVSIEERMNEVKQRRHMDKEKIDAVNRAKDRFLALEQELSELAGFTP